MFFVRAALLTMFLIAVVPSITFAQEMSEDTYKKTYEELKERKENLTEEEKALRAELEAMRTKIDSMKEAYTQAVEDILIMKYGEDDGRRVSQGRIWTGMTDDMLRDSWGEPDRTTKNVEPWGVFTQWYYGEITFFFRDGRLTAWEDKSKEGEGRKQ